MSSQTQSIKQGSVLGGILLIAGSCIGAGMLALPVITGVAGFFPASFMFFLAWLFMTVTSLLLLEANLALGYDLSLISIAEKTLGRPGKILTWILFVFLFYSLSIAYISASGEIIQTIVQDLFAVTVPSWIGSLLFTVIFGVVIYIGTKPVDYLNRLLMFGLIISYFVLVFLGMKHVHFDYLTQGAWKYAFAAIPILIVSFGFQNMIPTLAQYLHGDVKRLRTTIYLGSLIPLIVYIVWEAVMLGIIPLNGREGLMAALDKEQAATSALRAIVGQSWITTVAMSFALFAIVTSFLAQSLSLVDFLSDGLNIAKVKAGRVFLVLLTLVPPFLFAYLNKCVFLTALGMAGGFSAVLLFGVMPVMMIYVLRYKRKIAIPEVLPASKWILGLILAFALSVFVIQAAHSLGVPLLPTYEVPHE